MKLARAIHFDECDTRVFHSPARTGEWCVSGGFEFSNWSDGNLVGKARQGFLNGWMGCETFGRVSFVAVTQIEPAERDWLIETLARHFVQIYSAPSLETARPVAIEEIDQMQALCDDHPPNTLLTVTRELTQSGLREAYRIIPPQEAGLEPFAIHAASKEPRHRH